MAKNDVQQEGRAKNVGDYKTEVTPNNGTDETKVKKIPLVAQRYFLDYIPLKIS